MNTTEQRLHAYHDGELSGFARWRFEREIRRSKALQAELDRLSSLRDLLQAKEADEPAPDIWDAIALRLPAADAQRREADAGRSGVDLTWWLKPVGAVAATAAVAVVAVYGGLWPEPPVAAGGVVRWIDSGERSVMVLDDDPGSTIIWVLDRTTEGAWIGGRRDHV